QTFPRKMENRRCDYAPESWQIKDITTKLSPDQPTSLHWEIGRESYTVETERLRAPIERNPRRAIWFQRKSLHHRTSAESGRANHAELQLEPTHRCRLPGCGQGIRQGLARGTAPQVHRRPLPDQSGQTGQIVPRRKEISSKDRQREIERTHDTSGSTARIAAVSILVRHLHSRCPATSRSRYHGVLLRGRHCNSRSAQKCRMGRSKTSERTRCVRRMVQNLENRRQRRQKRRCPLHQAKT